MEFNKEQQDVIDEIVASVKSDSSIITSGTLRHRMTYNFNHGKGSWLELLNDAFEHIVDSYTFTDKENERLIRLLDRHYREWKLVKDIDQFNWNDVIFDGNGYVVLKGGTRLDIEPDMFKEQREAFNAKRQNRFL